jgi:hypothetical protein
MTMTGYPVRVEATLDERLSRWRWLVKWFLAIPHYVVLVLLWIAFVVLSVYAFFAILFTGRYPRGAFDFNVGVLRWSWRVHYYTFGALATDRYPPFTLGEVADYPAHLEIAYPQHLSRGLVLVKWWLLAIPHYLVTGVFLGGGGWLAWRAHEAGAWTPVGLIGLLAVIAAVILLFTGNYPRQIYDFVLGMNRWVLRVAAYAALMTDSYPPFQLDMGGHDPATTLVISQTAGPASAVTLDKPPAAAGTPRRAGWTAPRVVAVVIGSVLALVALGLIGGGGAALWFDQHRDGGYVTSSVESRHSDGYAIVSDRVSIGKAAFDWRWERDLLGKVRIHATSEASGGAVFIGIAPSDAVDRYLADVPHTALGDLGGDDVTTTNGTSAPAAPTATSIWVAQASGTGEQTVIWSPRGGDWTVVVMNANGARGVSVRGDVGATIPALPWLAVGLFAAAAVLLVAALFLLVIPIRRASRAYPPEPAQEVRPAADA